MLFGPNFPMPFTLLIVIVATVVTYIAKNETPCTVFQRYDGEEIISFTELMALGSKLQFLLNVGMLIFIHVYCPLLQTFICDRTGTKHNIDTTNSVTNHPVTKIRNNQGKQKTKISTKMSSINFYSLIIARIYVLSMSVMNKSKQRFVLFFSSWTDLSRVLYLGLSLIR